MNEKINIDLSTVDQTTLTIPKIIMQTWKTEKVPSKWLPSQQSIIKHLVSNNWKYVLLTDKDNEDFVRQFFPQYLSVYLSLPYNIQRADMIRYMWLYIYGGIYMDLDYEIIKPIDDLFRIVISNLYLTPGPGSGIVNIITNSFMASTPKCEFWLKCLEEIKNHTCRPWYYSRHFYILQSTGPMMVQRVFDKYTLPIAVIPRQIIHSCDICHNVCVKNTYLKALGGDSWHDWDSTIINWVACNPSKCTLIIIILLLVILCLVWYLLKNKLCKSVCNKIEK
jgi:mannosyltransferase OCH1-like enzyme